MNICALSIIIISLLYSMTSVAGISSNQIQPITGLILKSEETKIASTANSYVYTPTEIFGADTKCQQAGEVMIGYSVGAGTYTDYAFSRDVHFDMSGANYTNYNLPLMTGRGVVTIYCTKATMGFP